MIALSGFCTRLNNYATLKFLEVKHF